MSLRQDLKNRSAEYEEIATRDRSLRVKTLFEVAKSKITQRARDRADSGCYSMGVNVEEFSDDPLEVEALSELIVAWLRSEEITTFDSGSTTTHFEFRWYA